MNRLFKRISRGKNISKAVLNQRNVDDKSGSLEEVPPAPLPDKSLRNKQKRRRNAQLRKELQPKDATTILNEMVGPPLTFEVTKGARHKCEIYHASIEINAYHFEGEGKSINEAKHTASEKALKHLLRNRLEKEKECLAENKEGPDTKKLKPAEEEDDFNWGGLASFALNKLYNEWNIEVPRKAEPRPEGGTISTRHPVTVLYELVPNAKFEEPTDKKKGPFSVWIELNGEQYYGLGRTKKEAKKRCAKEALFGAFKISFN